MNNFWIQRHEEREERKKHSVSNLIRNQPGLAKRIFDEGLGCLNMKEWKFVFGNSNLSYIDEIYFEEDLKFMFPILTGNSRPGSN